ncbi:hypothetical protein [Bacillus phage SDFMU_Pbc]|uniref:Uncharacterized protein n=1 Tax=Bacillus phage SDFMU_Pbc TaxID=3076135 RepID=A0AA96KRY6_9CAUD|nr:hypothetical protein [Bacillus phage SDFMU_Pbc]
MAKAVRKVFISQYNAHHIDLEGKLTQHVTCWDTRRKNTNILLVANEEDLEFDHATVVDDEIAFVLRKGSQLNFAAVGEKGIYHYDDE